MIEKNNGAYYKNKIMIVQLNILNVIYSSTKVLMNCLQL